MLYNFYVLKTLWIKVGRVLRYSFKMGLYLY